MIGRSRSLEQKKIDLFANEQEARIDIQSLKQLNQKLQIATLNLIKYIRINIDGGLINGIILNQP